MSERSERPPCLFLAGVHSGSRRYLGALSTHSVCVGQAPNSGGRLFRRGPWAQMTPQISCDVYVLTFEAATS